MTHLKRRSSHKHCIRLSQLVMHEVNSSPVHYVTKECHLRFKYTATGITSRYCEVQHLLVFQKHVSIWGHSACTCCPARVKSFKTLLKLSTWSQLPAAQTHNPKSGTNLKSYKIFSSYIPQIL